MDFGEDNFALGGHAIDVVDAAGNELFEQIVGLVVAQLIEPGPELAGSWIFFMPMPEACERGFSSHGAGTRVMNSRKLS